MIDAEIIKALECCIDCDCTDCPCNTIEGCKDIDYEATLDLINRQKAEIERLKEENTELDKANVLLTLSLQNAQAEAIKEFAERLKKLARPFPFYIIEAVCGVTVTDIDNLVKEKVGE